MKEIALLIPCYNEAKRFKIELIRTFIAENQHLIDFYFVDDGSTDETNEIIKQNFLNEENSYLIRLNKNFGKGNAVRQGMLAASQKDYDYYGFIDADFEIPFEQVVKLYESLKESECSLAISFRRFSNPFHLLHPRSLGSRFILSAANSIVGFNPKIKDSQCGSKLLKKDILHICFDEEFISEWLFDIEIFSRLNKSQDARGKILEVPLENFSRAKGESNIRLLQNFQLLKHLYLIKRHYNR